MTEQTSDIHTIIKSLAENFESTFARGDAAKISKFYTDKGVLLPAGSAFIKGTQAIKEYWQAAIDMGIQSIKLDIIEIEQHDDTAIEMSVDFESGLCLLPKHCKSRHPMD